ncbi:hypothetical protein U8V72_27390 [Priestia filamentosa]|uniref:hypothetical protein n=1 Tax=Priestia filamentosa TaxID=1402861 RepID=UPI00397CD9CB
MANVEQLKEKVTKAHEKVEKCKKTIERHEKAREKKIVALEKKGIHLTGFNKEQVEKVQDEYRQTDLFWEIYEVKKKLDDIKSAIKKLEDAQGVLERWKAKLKAEKDKDGYIHDEVPQVIKDFLNHWKQLAYEWYVKRYNNYQLFKEKLEKEVEEARDELGIKRGFFPTKSQEEQLKKRELDYKSVEKKKRKYAGDTVLHMCEIYNEEKRLKWLDDCLEEDKKIKMLRLVNRIKKVVGTITDATELRIGLTGEINGLIVGENGKATVETISAGGWNIQCFHFRTLVHEVN